MRINLDLSDLEAFVVVMDTGSFHLAAKRLNLSQPAVSRRIQKLEESLDSVLFERTTRQVRPTLAAKRLKPRAEAILEDLQETARTLRDESVEYDHQRNLVLTIAMVPTVMTGLFLPALKHYQTTGAEARFRLLDLAANDVCEAVAKGDADLGICSIPKLDPTIEFETLFEDELLVAMHPSHELAANGPVSIQQLEGMSLILPSRGTGNRMLIDDAMAAADMSLRWTFEVERTTTALTLASDKQGIALLPRSALSNSNDATIAHQLLVEPSIKRPIGLVSRRGQIDSPAITAFKQCIREAAQQQPPNPGPA